MATTVVGTLEILAKAREELDEWDCGRMYILVATSLTNGTLININLSDSIGHGKKVPKSEKQDSSNCFWLDLEWAENTDALCAKEVIPFFVGLQVRLVSESVADRRTNTMPLHSSASGEGAIINTKTKLQ